MEFGLSMRQQNTFEQFCKQYARHPFYRSPRGSRLNARSWQTEAPLRMLLNNLDAEVAEDPSHLIVYGGTGQAARDCDALNKILHTLYTMDEDQTLLVQSGKPVALIKTHLEAPRVLIANSNLVPHWATWEHFLALKKKGLMMYGQMTAGSWIYIGTQGILQGTYQTFASVAEKHFKGTLKGTLTVTGGLGGMGGAQPLSVTMNGGVILAADVDSEKIRKRLNTRYLDKMTSSYEEAKNWVLEAKKQGVPLSVGLVEDVGTMLWKLLDDGIVPEVCTDQTSAHDPLNGYVPAGIQLEDALKLRKEDPQRYQAMAMASMARHVGAMLEMKRRGTHCFDYGNNLREFAKRGGEKRAFEIPGFVPEYIRPFFCEGKGPFRWVALSGDPEDIYKTDAKLLEIFSNNRLVTNWLGHAKEKIAFQGLPARICWLGLQEREQAGKAFNEMVAKGEVKAPIIIGRDHLDAGSVASPYRETEAMLDGSDAISDWPLLNALGNCASGATWVSIHHGGGVGMGFSQHAGMVVLADGTARAGRCLERVLHHDPALGVVRHADAGYEQALEVAKKLNASGLTAGNGQ